ncbi:hypothetical protein [Halobacterium bonnevillei]|uniref:Uncharacterized protein n=1 Tax=Halobacterium bonnevillei TaxID=2692200 RepID=A0A6B0SLD5_9EURY|nr:hypothetical protein [Halobacterium bonnevillei]MXR20501.1 hypothetical protein [Halobacterium bonnevillei]
MNVPDTPFETKVRATFVVVGVLCWYGTTLLTEAVLVQLTVLLGVGLVVPQILLEVLDREH